MARMSAGQAFFATMVLSKMDNDVYKQAIEATARELGPDVDPVALAEAARDGRWLSFAIDFTAHCLLEDELSMAGLSPPEAEWRDKLAALRAGKGGE